MAFLSAENLAGPGYIILNILRVINIITLASVVASSIVMLVKTFIVSKFFFFDATSHVVTALAGLFLVVSECSLFRSYFAKNWPLLSSNHGFVALGSSMMVLGSNMLGNMNKEATSQKSLGLPFWRLLVASGILSIVIGFFNIIASFVFCDKARKISARRVRSDGAITLTEEIPHEESDVESKLKAFTISTHHTGSTARTASPMRVHSHHTGSTISRNASPHLRVPGTPPVDMGSPQPSYVSPQKEDRLSQSNFNPINLWRNTRQSLLPSYHSTAPSKPDWDDRHKRSSSIYSRSTSGYTKRSWWLKRGERDSEVPDVPKVPEISGPINVNPQFAHLVRPSLAHHPSQRRPETDFDKI